MLNDKEMLHEVFKVIDELIEAEDYAEEETWYDKLRALKKAWREENESEWIDCPECDGTGVIDRMTYLSYSGNVGTELERCDHCKGTGKVAEK